MKKARGISPDGIIGYNIMVALKEYASHVKAAVQAALVADHLRRRTSYRAPCSCQRKQNKDRPHRLH